MQPNIITIMCDDLGFGDLSCYGSTSNKTPHIDALAASGVRCTQFHSNGTVCSPTRAAFITGQYQQRCGIEGVVSAANHRDVGIDPSHPSLPRALNHAGYRTALFGKWHLGYKPEFGPRALGFDEYRGFVSGNVDYFSHIDQAGHFDWWVNEELSDEPGYTTDVITDHACRYMAENAEAPFFMFLPYAVPHYPYQGPRDHAERTEQGDFDIYGARDDYEVAYSEMLEHFDTAIGRLVATLEACQLRDNTLIIFTTDHGATPVGDNGPLRKGKGSLYQGGIRVPAIISWPDGKFTLGCNDDLILSMDLSALISDVSGASMADPDGTSPLAALRGQSPMPPRQLCWRYGDWSAVRAGEWKWVRHGDVEELFRIYEDESESDNLIEANPETVAELKAAFATWEADVCSQGMKA